MDEELPNDDEGKGGIITSIQLSEILRQMGENICLIEGINGEKATGFFCKLPYPDQLNLIPALITNSQILNKENTQLNKTIKLTMNDDKRKIYLTLDSSRKIFIDESLGITIIEIKQKDKIDNYFDLEDNFDIDNYMKKKKTERKLGIYVLYYKNPKNASYSGGIINSIDENKIIHSCDIEIPGAPILLLSNYKVIGIHTKTIKTYQNKEYKEGINIKFPIEKFKNRYPINMNNSQNNNYNNNNQNNINNNQNNNFNNQTYNNNQNNNFNNQTNNFDNQNYNNNKNNIYNNHNNNYNNQNNNNINQNNRSSGSSK